MSQLQHTPRPAPFVRAQDRMAFFFAAICTVAILVALTAAVGIATRPSGGTTAGRPADVTDGWMFGTSAIAAPRTAPDITDGWASRYLVAARPTEVTDGWAGRLLVPARAQQVTDGWAGRYLR